MMKAHVIENGKVVNTIEVGALDFMPGLVDSALGGKIGDLWDGAEFSEPPEAEPSVPKIVTMRQARLALLGAGLLDAVPTAIAALPSPQKEEAQIEWEYSQEVCRDWPLIAELAPVLGLNEAETDALFIAASQM